MTDRNELFKEIVGCDVEDASQSDLDKAKQNFMDCATGLVVHTEVIEELECLGFTDLAMHLRELKKASDVYDLSREV
jgi:hypothetical protein